MLGPPDQLRGPDPHLHSYYRDLRDQSQRYISHCGPPDGLPTQEVTTLEQEVTGLKGLRNILHLVIYQTLLFRATYSKYRDILPEASRLKCLAQCHFARPGIKTSTFRLLA